MDPTLEQLVSSLCDEIDTAVNERERPRGGQSVPSFSQLANAPPSTLSHLRWWSRELRKALDKTRTPPETSSEGGAHGPVGTNEPHKL